MNSKAYPGFDCGSDHNLLVAEVKLRIKAPRKKKIPVIYNLMALKENQVEQEYAVSIRNKFQQLNFLQEPELPDTNAIWQRG